MSASGQKAPSAGAWTTSACPSKTDIQQALWHVRLVPPQSVAGSCGGRGFVRGRRDRTSRGYPLQENSGLQFQGADPREHRAVFSVQHLFCSIRGNAILGFAPRHARCKFVRDRGGAFSKQSILRNPARPAERECSAGHFCNPPGHPRLIRSAQPHR
jgi:hypothetical protein